MKKVTLLAVAVLAISFASCKKDRTCTCSTTYSGGNSSITGGSSVVKHKKITKGQGKAVCHDTESTDSSSGVTETTSCSLS